VIIEPAEPLPNIDHDGCLPPKGWPPHQLLCCHCGNPIHDSPPQPFVHHDRLFCAACEVKRVEECGS
jgi:hypothetical protein